LEDVLYYSLPDEAERKSLIELVMGTFLTSRFNWGKILSISDGLSQAEIGAACRDAIKEAVLHDRSKVSATELISSLNQRRQVYSGL